MPTTFAVARFRSRKRRSGTSGALDARLDPEEHRRAARRRRPSRPSVSRGRPSRPRSRSRSRRRRPWTPRSPSPHLRRRAVRRAIPPLAGSSASVSANDGDADGTLTRKIQCQSSVSVRTPPRRTPMRAAAGGDEPEDAHRLRALRGLGEQRDDQRERDRRDDRPADALHRAGGDQKSLRVAPGRRRCDARVNSAIPARNIRRCPTMSPRRPPRSRKPPKVSR